MKLLKSVGLYLAAGLGALVASCAAPPAPEPPPAPQLVSIPVPQRPQPPASSMLDFPIPPKDAYGSRITPNSFLGEDETVWHFRSAFNVAALNCQDGAYLRIADDYNLFIANNDRELARINRSIEAKFRSEHGREAPRIRDTHSTQVYNYFSLPPVKSQFCNTMYSLGQQAATITPDQLTLFAARTLPQIEVDFESFFTAYEQYEADLALWTAVYAPNSRAASYSGAPYGPTAEESLSSSGEIVPPDGD